MFDTFYSVWFILSQFHSILSHFYIFSKFWSEHDEENGAREYFNLVVFILRHHHQPQNQIISDIKEIGLIENMAKYVFISIIVSKIWDFLEILHEIDIITFIKRYAAVASVIGITGISTWMLQEKSFSFEIRVFIS